MLSNFSDEGLTCVSEFREDLYALYRITTLPKRKGMKEEKEERRKKERKKEMKEEFDQSRQIC